ncbi:enterotoxin A family protein [Alcanivoracaceae bacterium MT1]
MRFVAWFIAFFLVFSLFGNARAENGGFLFRVDTRPPSVVIYGGSEGGFSPLGDDESLVAHVRGATCLQGSRTSGYISVSSDPEWADNYARRLYSLRGGEPVYVYVIRQTRDFYNAARVLRTRFPDDHPYVQSAERQSEWVTRNNITTADIYGVREFSEAAIDPNHTPPIQRNIQYSDEASSVNNGTFLINDYEMEVFDSGRPRVVSRAPLVGTCLSATLSCLSRSERERRDVNSSSRCYIEPVLGNVMPAIGLLRH